LIEFLPGESRHILSIVSTKRVIVIDDQLRIRTTYEPKGFIASVEHVSANHLSLREYDVDDPRCPIVERAVQFS
jgi:hypothetical protein